MSLRKESLIFGLGSLALLTGLVWADEKPSPKDNIATPPAASESPAKSADSKAAGDSVDELIAQLDSPNFDDREAAGTKLTAKGGTAIAALEKAAANGNLEVASRAMTILGKLLKSADEPTENAAFKALQNLASGDNSAARKAKSILDMKYGTRNNDVGVIAPGGGVIVGGGGFGGQIVINGGQVNIGGPGGAMRTLSVRNVNGVKEITASEDGKTVKIQDGAAQGIKIDVTEKDNGKDVTKNYSAKDVDDLKKNHPAGYEIYKKYCGDQTANGAAQLAAAQMAAAQMRAAQLRAMQMQAVQLNVQAGGQNLVPLQPAIPAQGQVQVQPAIPGQFVPARIDAASRATRLLKSLSLHLESLQRADEFKNASPESKAELKNQIDDLSKRLDAIRGELGGK